MSPVIVNSRLAPAAAGAFVPTSQALIAGHYTAASDTIPKGPVRSTADLEAAYGATRATALFGPLWDYLDYAFKEGLQQAYVASYGGSDTIDTALALFDPSYGPAHVVAPHETISSALHAKLATHANTYGRYAYADAAQGSTLAAMQTLGDGLPTDATGERIALIGPWLNVAPPPGVIGGAERIIPASAAWLGVTARVDRDGNPNRAPGGRDYALQAADSLTLATTESQRDVALGHKVNLIRLVDGVLQVDSAQSAIPQDPVNPFWQVNCGRTRMWARYYAGIIARGYYMKSIDAEGHVAGALKQQLIGMLADLHSRDALYGDPPGGADPAYDVNVGTAINTTASAANATLNSVAQMKLDLYAKTVEVDLVTVPVLGNVIPS